MTHIVLDASAVTDRGALHDLLKERLSLPAWYGGNLDALYDCLTDLREVTLILRGADALTRNLGDYGARFLAVLEDSEAENPGFHCTRL